jgi:hypothetical protein
MDDIIFCEGMPHFAMFGVLTMNEGAAALLAGVIAAVAALIAAIIGGVVAMKTEAKRRDAERHADAIRELRQRAADAFVQMFALQHELEWITWHAKYDPTAVNEEMIAGYTSSVHVTFPRLLGAMAIIRPLGKGIYVDLYPLTEYLYSLDRKVAQILIRLRDPADSTRALDDLASLAEECGELYSTLPDKLADVMEAAGLHELETLSELET